MSENYLDTDKEEPDFFGFYSTEVAELLSQDESIWPFSNKISLLPQDIYDVGKEKKGKSKASNSTKEQNGSSGSAAPLFSNGIGALISEFKNERLNSLLRQSVFSLTQEVDEIVDPVLSLCRIRTCLRCKESRGLECNADQIQHAHKKQRLLSSLGSEGKHVQINEPAKEPSNDIGKKCIVCHRTETPQWRPAPDGTKSICNACGLKAKKNALKLSPVIVTDTDKEKVEIDDDLRVILENDSTKVEELMRRYSSEFLAKLQHMEQKLEELLNSVMTSCRPMTPIEKQQLRKIIQNLPPKNLDRVVEIIEYNKPLNQYSSDEIKVELDNEDNITLWRLYFYATSITRES